MLKNKKIGFLLTGEFSCFPLVIPKIRELINMGAIVVPIMSYNARLRQLQEFIAEIEQISSRKIISTIEEAETIGIKHLTDIIVVAPCNGNTLSKLANSIADTTETVAVNANIRNENNVVIAISTNDGLAGNAVNVGILLNRKHFYFVPFRQNNPITKPYAISFDKNYLIPTIEQALSSKQLQPVLL